jgi:hypothetical protein
MTFGSRTGKFGVLDGSGHEYTMAHRATMLTIHTAFTNLIRNGAFDDGLTHWTPFGSPSSSNIVAAVNSGVLEFFRPPPPPGTTSQATARFDLGNSSSVRKRVSVLIIDADFSDLHVCTFWIPANQALTTYEMRTHTTKAWDNAALYFYAASPGSDGGAYRVDNVSLQYTPGVDIDQTECLDPLAPPPTGDPPGPNLLINGDFETGGISPWVLFGQIAGQVAMACSSSSARPASRRA